VSRPTVWQYRRRAEGGWWVAEHSKGRLGYVVRSGRAWQSFLVDGTPTAQPAHATRGRAAYEVWITRGVRV